MFEINEPFKQWISEPLCVQYIVFSVLFKENLQNVYKTHPHQRSDFPLGEREEILRLLAMLYESNQRNEEQFDCRHGERDIFPGLPELQTT